MGNLLSLDPRIYGLRADAKVPGGFSNGHGVLDEILSLGSCQPNLSRFIVVSGVSHRTLPLIASRFKLLALDKLIQVCSDPPPGHSLRCAIPDGHVALRRVFARCGQSDEWRRRFLPERSDK